MTKREDLRDALLELSLLREQEAMALRESKALLHGLAKIARADTPEAGLQALLLSLRETFACDAAVLLAEHPDGVTIELSTQDGLSGVLPGAYELLDSKPRRIVDLSAKSWWGDNLPEGLGTYRALLTGATIEERGRKVALACLSRDPSAFTLADARLLNGLSDLATQVLGSLALSEHNALLAAVIEGSAASVTIADAASRDLPLIYVNEAFEHLTGYRKEEVIGRNCRFLSAEPDDSPVRKRLRRTIAALSPGSFELLNRRKDGSEFWNRLTLYPVYDSNREIRYLVATQVDVSERRKVEGERDQARDRLASALSSTSEGFLLVDSQGTVVFANDRFRDFFRCENADWVPGATFLDLVTTRLVEQGKPYEVARSEAKAHQNILFTGCKDLEMRLPDGRVLLLNDRLTPDGGVVSVVTDITAMKQSEQLLGERAAAMDAAQDGIAICDQHGAFVYLNSSHLRLFGYQQASEIMGRHWSVLYRDEQVDFLSREVVPALQQEGTWRGEVPGLGREGDLVAQEISLTLLPAGGLVSVTRDISERLKNERERSRMNEQLYAAQRHEAIGQLAAGFAHDFNNLLASVTGSASLLMDELPEGSMARAHAERILAAGARAGTMVERLLELGTRQSERRRLDLREPLAEAADLLRGGGPSRAAVRVQSPNAALYASADPTDVLQVLLNLAINAREALISGHGQVELRLALAHRSDLAEPCTLGQLDQERKYALFTVTDNGPGIPQERLKRIFQPYFTTKGAAGTGLGLAVVASIVKTSRGAIRIDSQPGEGTCFQVFWPLEQATDSKPRTAATNEEQSLEGMTILAVDDVGAVVQVIASLLESQGAEVATCDISSDALSAIEEDAAAWDLLITDYDMPGLSGLDLATRARELRPDLPILLCTALSGRRHLGDSPDEIFDAIVQKPVKRRALIAAVKQAIVTRQARVR
ncbi:MAG: PAS domain S-box protein [Pseudomonadota bacterium]